jgi:hypothetical protein
MGKQLVWGGMYLIKGGKQLLRTNVKEKGVKDKKMLYGDL